MVSPDTGGQRVPCGNVADVFNLMSMYYTCTTLHNVPQWPAVRTYTAMRLMFDMDDKPTQTLHTQHRYVPNSFNWLSPLNSRCCRGILRSWSNFPINLKIACSDFLVGRYHVFFLFSVSRSEFGALEITFQRNGHIICISLYPFHFSSFVSVIFLYSPRPVMVGFGASVLLYVYSVHFIPETAVCGCFWPHGRYRVMPFGGDFGGIPVCLCVAFSLSLCPFFPL